MTTPWWQTGVVYQVYPWSFADADGDGIGDLAGVTAHLDHLVWLGVDAVWLSPIYPSPMADFGYDVSDHTDVDPRFGTLADADRLIARAHDLGLKVLLDFVPNHTSEQHPWFVESRSARDSPKRDWYLWRDPAPDGGPPNNWRGNFGGAAWTLDAATGQYYAHAYLPEQPDLDWRNPAVVAAMSHVLRFWRERGVDGFRVDAMRQIGKHPELADDPVNPDWHDGLPPYHGLLHSNSADQDDIVDMFRAIRAAAGEDAVLIGEAYAEPDRLAHYYGPALDAIHLPTNMHLLQLDWTAEAIGAFAERYEAALPDGAWPNWVLGNHDRPRVASRAGAGQERVAALLLLTLRGTPTVYYGDEIGMADATIPPGRVQDPWELREPGRGLGRDPVRTPMRWDGSPGAGFSAGAGAGAGAAEPWLPLGDDLDTVNVAAQRDDPDSLLSLYRRLLATRRASAALTLGDFTLLRAADGVLAYARRSGDEHAVVALNLGAAPRTVDGLTAGRVLIATERSREGTALDGTLTLAGGEGLVIVER